MARRREIAIEIKARNKTSKEFRAVSRDLSEMASDAHEASETSTRSFRSISRTAQATLGIVVTGAIRDLSLQLGELSKRGGQVEETQRVFERLSESIGSTMPDALEDLRDATHGMVSNMDLMQASNKFVAMGLAETSERAAELAEMSTQLGMAMGTEPVAAAENFALMLANQSIPRLDTYGISAGKVRERILELMAANKEMTREQAFTQATMEQGRIAMEKVGSSAGGTAERMARATARSANFRDMLARKLGPALAGIAGPLSTFASTVGPLGQVAIGLTGLTDLLPGLASGIVGIGSAAKASVMGLRAYTVATNLATLATTSFWAALGPLAVMVAGFAILWKKQDEHQAKLVERMDNYTIAIVKQSETYEEYIETITRARGAGDEEIAMMLRNLKVTPKMREEYALMRVAVMALEEAQREHGETIAEFPEWYKRLAEATGGVIDTGNTLVDVYTGKHLPMWYRQIEATGEYIEGIDEVEVAQKLLAATTWETAEYQLKAWDALAQGPEGLIAGMKQVSAVTKDEFLAMVQAQVDAQAEMDKQAKITLKKRLDERKKFTQLTAKTLADLAKRHKTNVEAREEEEERYTRTLEELREKEGDAYRRGYVNVERMKAENAGKLVEIEERYSKQIRRASEKRRGELIEDMSDLTQKQRQQGEERIGAALRNTASWKSAQLGAVAEARAAEEERHLRVLGQFATEREEMLMTAAVQALAARTYEDGTTALSRLFDGTIEGAEDLFEALETGTKSLSKRDLVALVRAMLVVAKQQSKNQRIAEDYNKLWADALKKGKELEGERLAAAAKIEPAFREMYDTQELLIDQIIEGQSEYDRWGENAVRNIEDVDSGLVVLDATMQSHYGTTGLVAVAYETMAARARAALASIPPFPAFPTPVPKPAPKPGWYPPRAYQHGGIVPGPIGRPQLAVVHGGEEIYQRGARGRGGVVLDFRGAQFYGITQDFVEDLFKEHELIRELQGVRARNP